VSKSSLPVKRSAGKAVAGKASGVDSRKETILGRYSGQSGSVYVVGEMFIGRYRVLIPESQKWARRAVPIGRRKEMTKPGS